MAVLCCWLLAVDCWLVAGGWLLVAVLVVKGEG